MAMIQFMPQKTEARKKPPFEQVYGQYYSGVVSYLRNKTRNAEDAEDLCSEAFVYCFDHYDDFDPEKSSVSTWIYMVVNSRLKNYYRDAKEYVDIEPLSNVIADESDDMEQAVYLQQLRDGLAKAIEKLPEKQQQIVILSYFKKKSSNEIADILGMTPGNVRVMLSRALNKLEEHCQDLRF